MKRRSLSETWHAFAERHALAPDLSRATRATLALAVPIVVAATGHLPLSVPFVAFAAQNVAMVDIRGSYTLRFGLLLAMTAILATAAHLGSLTAGHFGAMLLAGGLLAAAGGLWRHLIPDYGAPLAISSLLLFVIALAQPPVDGLAGELGLAAIVGGAWGLLLQIAYWPVKPQHPLRRAVSDSWVAVADLFEALAPGAADRESRIQRAEHQLRLTLDQTYAALDSHDPRRARTPLRTRLAEVNLAAAKISTRVVALNTALESLLATSHRAGLAESFQPVLTSLTNFSRSTAVTVVSRQPGHLATFEVRLRRLRNLLRVFQERLRPSTESADDPAAPLRTILRQIDGFLPAIHEALRATVDRADERAAFSLELFDLHTWTLRPLAAALTFNRRIDPALLRFSARIAVLTMAGLAAYHLLHLPHGYWLPLTTVIVLQPDYGSTRQRALQRSLGTLVGSVAASFLLWLQPTPVLLTVAIAALTFGFGFFVKRNYAVAVIFITLIVVLLTEAHETVTLAFTAERLASTVAGGVLAVLAAMFFWPVWERHRLPPVLAAALDANRDYLRLVNDRLVAGGPYDETAIAAKRRAEAANAAVFSSLQRMMGDPRNQQEGLEHVAALANGNQRITRAYTVVALHLGTPIRGTGEVAAFAQLAEATLERLSRALRVGTAPDPELAGVADALRAFEFPALSAEPAVAVWLVAPLARVATELDALILAAEQIAAPPATPAAAVS